MSAPSLIERMLTGILLILIGSIASVGLDVDPLYGGAVALIVLGLLHAVYWRAVRGEPVRAGYGRISR